MLNDKVAIVTGSTSGIGLGIAAGLAKAGCNLMLNGLGDPDEIEKTRAELAAAHSVRALYSAADMTKPDEIGAMVEQTKAELGSVDIIVNNAGIQHVAPVDEFPVEKWNAIIAINLTSAFHMIRFSVPLMKQQGWGRIINLASAHGLIASPYKSAYVSAKHGMLGLTKTVALEVAEQGITCNAICPGYVLTPLVDGQIDDTAKARGIDRDTVIRDVMLVAQPTKRFVTVEELAGLTVFLCDEAGASINGAALPMDGGWTAS
jgi:3-hydroxybutyrate dehydrogenase